MRPFYLFILLLLIGGLAACGSEEQLTTPPTFSNIIASGSSTLAARVRSITISGTIDDFAAKIVANSTATGDKSVNVDSSDGSWNFPFSPQDGANILRFTATDERGNINQMSLTVLYNSTAPVVTAITNNVVDPAAPKLVVTFNQTIVASSLATALFAVDGISLTSAPLLDSLTPTSVTLPLSEELAAGLHNFTYSGVGDLTLSVGTSIPVSYSFDFTIQ